MDIKAYHYSRPTPHSHKVESKLILSLVSNPTFRDLSVGGMVLPKDTMVFPLFAEILKVTINNAFIM